MLHLILISKGTHSLTVGNDSNDNGVAIVYCSERIQMQNFENNFIYLICIIFGCAGSLLLFRTLSPVAASGGRSLAEMHWLLIVWLLLLLSMGSRACRLQELQLPGFRCWLSSGGAWAQPLHTMWDFPGIRDRNCVSCLDRWTLHH